MTAQAARVVAAPGPKSTYRRKLIMPILAQLTASPQQGFGMCSTAGVETGAGSAARPNTPVYTVAQSILD
jgi:hypothetical protein